jgi:hypothetical protein
MSTLNSYVGFIVGGSDIVIISKSVLPNKSIRYDIEFEFSRPNGYSVYTWTDKFHDEFSVLFEDLSGKGSKVTKKDDKWVLEGPCLIRMDNVLYEVCFWYENPFEYVEKVVDTSDDCQKTPYEVLNDVLVVVKF